MAQANDPARKADGPHDMGEAGADENRSVGRLAEALLAVDVEAAGASALDRTLAVALDHIVAATNAAAAAVLLPGPDDGTLTFAAGRGFRTSGIARSRRRLREDFAAQAAREKRVVGLPDLPRQGAKFARSAVLAEEDFASYHAVPLLTQGTCVGVLEAFHRVPFAASKAWLDLVQALAGPAAAAIRRAILIDEARMSCAGLSAALDAVLEAWVRALELRDYESEGHIRRLTEMTLRLGRDLGLDETQLTHVRRGVLLHDIGKTSVPDAILLKPGSLTNEEWAIIRKHPQYAYDMLARIAFLRPALDIPYCHHEHWDGTGYPRKLKGEQIPLAARIFAVIDVWDMLRSNRPYRKAWGPQKVIRYVRAESGKQFDPRIVEAFLGVIGTKPPARR